MGIDISKLAKAINSASKMAVQTKQPIWTASQTPKECYKNTDPCPEFEQGDIVEVYLEDVKDQLINPDQVYYEAVVIGKAWNIERSKWDWILDLGGLFIKDTESNGKRKSYRYHSLLASQESIVKEKPLEFTNKLTLSGYE